MKDITELYLREQEINKLVDKKIRKANSIMNEVEALLFENKTPKNT